MLRNLNQSSGGKRILGTSKSGTRGDAIPTTGTDGGSILASDVTLPADAAVEFRAEILTWPATGTLEVAEDGAFTYIASQAGTTSFTYRPWRNGVAGATYTVTLIAGVSASAGVATGSLAAMSMTAMVGNATTIVIGSQLANLTLKSTAGVTLGAFAVGHAFRKGQIPSGYIPTSTLPHVQATVRNRWPDGSVKFALIAGRATIPTASTVQVPLAAGVDPGGTALTEADLTASGVTATLDFGAFGSVSLAGLIGQTSTNVAGRMTPGRVRTLASGPEMSSWLYFSRFASHPHLSAWFEVRLFAGGAVHILPWIENATVMVAAPGLFADNLTFTLDGTTQFNEAVSITHHSRTVAISGTAVTGYWHGASNDITTHHDTSYLRTTNLVPNYVADSSASTRLAGLFQTYVPFQQGEYQPDMSNTGYWSVIGLMPESDVFYLTSNGDVRAFRHALAQAYSAGRYPFHMRDERSNLPIKRADFANVGYGGGDVYSVGSATTTTPATTGGAAPMDSAHLPSMGYGAYLMTGAWYHAETVQLLNAMNWLHEGDANWRRDGAKGLYQANSGTLQTRGAAWAIRSLAQALAVTPDGDSMQAELQGQWENNIDHYYTAYVVGPSNPQGFVRPNTEYSTGVDPYLWATWQDDFVTAAWGFATALDLPVGAGFGSKLTSFFAWKAQAIVGRLGPVGDASTFGFTQAANYTIAVAPNDTADWWGGTGPWYSTWGDVFTASKGASNSTTSGSTLAGGNFPDTTSYWGNLTPGIAYAKQHGIAGADAAYTRLTTAANYSTFVAGFTDNPVWGVAPTANVQGPSQAGVASGSMASMTMTPFAGAAYQAIAGAASGAMAPMTMFRATASAKGAANANMAMPAWQMTEMQIGIAIPGNAAGIMSSLGMTPMRFKAKNGLPEGSAISMVVKVGSITVRLAT